MDVESVHLILYKWLPRSIRTITYYVLGILPNYVPRLSLYYWDSSYNDSLEHLLNDNDHVQGVFHVNYNYFLGYFA